MNKETGEKFKAHELLKWAKEHWNVWSEDVGEKNYVYGYKFAWSHTNEHKNVRVCLFQHDYGFWLIIGSAPGGYGGSECEWNTVNVGSVYTIEEVEPVVKALGGYDAEFSTKTLTESEARKEASEKASIHTGHAT